MWKRAKEQRGLQDRGWANARMTFINMRKPWEEQVQQEKGINYFGYVIWLLDIQAEMLSRLLEIWICGSIWDVGTGSTSMGSVNIQISLKETGL